MAEETNVKEAVEEIRASDEEGLRKVIEYWFEQTRTSGMRIGAKYISAGIYDIIQKNIIKKDKPSLRDYKRMTDQIIKLIDVQLKTQQNDSQTVVDNAITEEIPNDN